MTGPLPDRMAAWARRTPGIAAVVLIGSRAGSDGRTAREADALSDWDFVVFTSDLSRFHDARWLAALELGAPSIYAVRDGIVGTAQRITVVLPTAEIDFVIVPAWPWRWRRWAFALGLHRFSPRLRRSLADLAIVARPGFRLLHGSSSWRGFYQQVLAEIADPRLDDATLIRRAGVFAADCVWLERKIARGEFVAAHRLIVRSLCETNLLLLHELKLRRGQASFPEGRRLERTATDRELAMVRPAPVEWTEASLLAAMRHAQTAMAELMRELVGERWRWPAR